MKKSISTIVVLLFVVSFSFSQDTITSKSGSVIPAKVLEVNTVDIKYKRFNNPDGPVFTMPKSDILAIRYENGTTDNFIEVQSSITGRSDKDLNTLGQTDASRYYRKYKGAGTGTLIAGIASPVLGLLPAIICASTPPKLENLNYPNEELMQKAAYYEGYTKKAKKIKQGKVWKNWGIAFGVNILAAIVIVTGQ